MTKRFQIVGAIVAVFIISFAVALVYYAVKNPSSADQPLISRGVVKIVLSPDQAQVDTGKTTEIDLALIAGKTKVSSIIFRIEYDPKIVSIDSFNKAIGLNEDPEVSINNSAGVASFKFEHTQALTGNGNLGMFVFSGQSPGTTKIQFSDEISPSVFADGAPRVPSTIGSQIFVQ